MSEPKTETDFAKCSCGAAQLKLRAKPTGVINCHCGQCRSFSGSAYTTWVSYPVSSVTITGTEHLAPLPTPNGVRHFCKHCGTHLYAADRRNESIFGILAGTICADIPSPTGHYFVSHKASWHTISDKLPQFGGPSGFEHEPMQSTSA